MKTKSYKKNGILFILIMLFAYHQSSLQADHQQLITCKGEWYISSPALIENPETTKLKRLVNDRLPTQLLKEIGCQAHEVWCSKKDNLDATLHLQKIFENVDRSFLVKLIDEVLENKQLLEKVAKASYRNVTGFLKIVLATGDNEDSWKIRLHFWELQEEKEFPHNHKWDFYSKIISGSLSQDLYKLSFECDAESAHSIREPVSLMPISEDGKLPCPCRDNYILKSKENTENGVSLRRYNTSIIGAYESYYMPNHLIHTITSSPGAISLVYTSDKKTDNSEVFVPMHLVNTDLSRLAPSITSEELKNKLIFIKELLSQLHVDQKYLPEMVDMQHHYYHMNGNDPILESHIWRNEIIQDSNRKIVIQLSRDDLERFSLSSGVNGAMLIGNKAIDPKETYLFVLVNEKMYAAPKDFHHQKNNLICHTSFSGYGPVNSAGVLRFDTEGTLIAIEAYSGHYSPSVENMKVAENYLKSIGINTDFAKLIPYQNR